MSSNSISFERNPICAPEMLHNGEQRSVKWDNQEMCSKSTPSSEPKVLWKQPLKGFRYPNRLYVVPGLQNAE